MAAFLDLLKAAGRYGRIILVLGIVAGIALPRIAEAMADWIGTLIALLLFLAVLRVGPRRALGALDDTGFTLRILLLLQCALPVALAGVFLAFGVMDRPLALAVVLMLAAAPLSGGPHIVAMTGHDPAPALRQMILGNALLPLTVIPVFWMTPALGSPLMVFMAALKLLLLIALAAAAALAVRAVIPSRVEAEAERIIDGISAIAMAVVVVGLMSKVGPALWTMPGDFWRMLAYVFALNFGLQVAATLVMRLAGRGDLAVSVGVLAGNRNIALFLAVLPAATTAQLLLFIGCYQIPIYLTALMMRGFYRLAAPAAGSRRGA